AVGRRFRDHLDRDHGARTRLVLDHDRLAEQLLEAGLHDARHRIRAAARREADDHPDRVLRIGARRAGRACDEPKREPKTEPETCRDCGSHERPHPGALPSFYLRRNLARARWLMKTPTLFIQSSPDQTRPRISSITP